MADRSMGYSVFFTEEGLDALRRGLAELAASLDSVDGRSVSAEADVDTRKAEEKIGAFARDIQARIDAAVAALPDIELGADASDVDRKIAEIRAELASLSSQRVGVGVDAVQASDRIRELSEQLKTLGAESANIQVRADTAKAAAELDGLRGRKVTIPADVDTTAAKEQAGAFADYLQSRVAAAIKNLPVITVDANTTDTDARLAEIKARLEELRDQRIGIDVSDADALARIVALKAELDALAHDSPDVRARFDAAAASAELTAFATRLSTLTMDIDTAAAEAKVGAFARDLQTRVSAAVRALPEVDLAANSSEVERRIAEIRAELLTLSRQRIGIDIDASQAHAVIQELGAELTLFSTQPVTVRAQADTTAAAAKLDALQHKELLARLDVDTGPAEANAGEFATRLQSRITAAVKALPDVELGADASRVDQRIAEIRAELADLSGRKIGVDADTLGAYAKVKELGAELERISNTVEIPVKVDTAKAAAELEGLGRAVDDAGNKAQGLNSKFGLDTALVNRWQQLTVAILAAAAAAGTPALALAGAGLASVTAGLQGMLGTAALFSGIKDGLTALDNAQQQATGNAQQLAAQQVTAANSVANAQDGLKTAQQGVTDAQRAAGIASTGAARQVADAQRAVTGAIRSQADSARSSGLTVQNALDAQASAERSLRNAQQQEENAQRSLTEARAAATRQLEDLNLQMQDAALAQRAAQLGVEQAQLDLNKSLGLGTDQQKQLAAAQAQYAEAQAFGSAADKQRAQQALDALTSQRAGTQLQREQAQLTYDQAVQQLKDQTVRGRQLAQDTALANAKGVEGADQVVTARQAAAAATQAESSAQHDLTKAIAAVAEAQRASGESAAKSREQIDAANQALRVAQAAQTETQRAGLESIAKANQSVVSAQRSLQDATLQAGLVGSQAMNAVAAAMSQLSPAGQGFAFFLHDVLVPELHGVRDSVQAAELPYLEAALENLTAIAPEVTAGLTGTAHVIGDLAVRGSQMVASGPWRADFALIMDTNNRVLRNYGLAGLAVSDAFRNITATATPLEEHLSVLANRAAESLAAWIQSQRDSGQMSVFFHDAGEQALELIKALAQITTTLLDLIRVLNPLSQFLVPIIGQVAEWVGELSTLDPALTRVIVTAGAFVAIWSKLSGISVTGVLKGELFDNLAPKIENAALWLGTYTEKAAGYVTSSENAAAAGEKVAASGSKVASALRGIGSALPGIGIAAIAASVAYDALVTSADDAAAAMQNGGAAAERMSQSMTKQTATAEALRNSTNGVAQLIGFLIPTSDDATKALDQMRAAMDPLTRAQSDAAKAQNDYLQALRDSGPGSDTARIAAGRYADATQRVKDVQQQVKDAIDQTNQRLQDQRDLFLGNIQGEIRYKDELAQLTQGVKDHGRATDLNTDAGRRNQDQLAQMAETLNQNLADMQKNGAAQADVTKKTDEYRTALLNAAMIIGYTKVEAQRYVNTVLGTPADRATVFRNNAGPVTQETQAYLDKLNLTDGAWIATFYANMNPAQDAVNAFLRNNQAVQSTLQISASIIGLTRRAEGGIDVVPMAGGGLRTMSPGIAQIVPPGTPTLIGDNKRVSESYIPWEKTPRSLEILDVTAQALGKRVVPMADGGVRGDTRIGQVAGVGLTGSVSSVAASARSLRDTVAALAGDLRGARLQSPAVASGGPLLAAPGAGPGQRAVNIATATVERLVVIQPPAGAPGAGPGAGAPVRLSPESIAAIAAATERGTRAGMPAQLRFGADGQGLLARAVNRQNRSLARV